MKGKLMLKYIDSMYMGPKIQVQSISNSEEDLRQYILDYILDDSYNVSCCEVLTCYDYNDCLGIYVNVSATTEIMLILFNDSKYTFIHARAYTERYDILEMKFDVIEDLVYHMDNEIIQTKNYIAWKERLYSHLQSNLIEQI